MESVDCDIDSYSCLSFRLSDKLKLQNQEDWYFEIEDFGTILFPPSPNWFLSGAVDSREEDAILVTASFKNIVVYQLLQDVSLPKILRMVPYQEKVQLVSIYPDASHALYGMTVGSCSDSGSVRLINMESGANVWRHSEHQGSLVTGLSWGIVGEEPVLVSVDDKSRMVVCQPRHQVAKVHKIPSVTEAACLETNPSDRSQALLAGGKMIHLVDLKDGNVLMQFQGHNSDIYCIKWFQGKGSPFPLDIQENDHPTVSQESKNGNESANDVKGPDSDNWRIKTQSPNMEGPFFASSDYGRQVFIWDLSAKRYVTEVSVPLSASYTKKFHGKEKITGKQHISLSWFKSDLMSTTPKGELLMWNLWPGGGRYTVIHHLHTRAIYNLTLIGNIAVSCGQDRFLQGYHVVSSSHMFQYPILGACATSLAFCPHDVNRLAIGSQENVIRLINFEGKVPLQTQVVWQNIKGKIMSLAWHPEHEGKLLFGTASGQVGWVDISGRVTSCAYYHQKSVYKVEWAPLMCPEKTGLSDTWCAYSFGDREIVIRSSSNAMTNPVHLLPLLSEPANSKALKDVTEFSFSCDYKYFAVGANDGQVRIYSAADLKLCVSLHVLRKAIQHILWQPPVNSSSSYVVAVGSNESRLCIFDLSAHFGKTPCEVEILTQATRDLCGHESRVVWLAWSPHKPDVLASASYDHTVQLWNANTGQMLVNYGGHTSRVFRVEFSPSDPDLMFSFGEENSLHSWRPSQLTSKTPGESLAKGKDRVKKIKEQAETGDQTCKDVAASNTVEKKSKPGVAGTSSEKPISGSTMVASTKRGIYKSFFPKLHSTCSKKKSFFHLIVVNLLNSVENNEEAKAKGKEVEEELSDELEESSSNDQVELCIENIENVCKQFDFLLEKDTEMPEPEELLYALRLYGKPVEMDELLTTEISEHVKRGSSVQGDLMHCWRGSLDEHIRNAARQKQLNPFLVSSAPQVSIKLWEYASEAYAEQLIEEGDFISAATYLVNINKVEEAIELLMKNRCFREAMSIAKCRRGYSEELVKKITLGWAASTIYEGAFDFAASLQVSIGQIEEAAATMARRNDHGSLFVASLLYQHAEKKDLTKSIGLLSLKEACIKQDHDKIDRYLAYLPELEWFRIISCCHQNLVKLVQEVTSDEQSPTYCIVKSQVVNKGNTETEEESVIVSDVEESMSPIEKYPFLQHLTEELINYGFKDESYPHLYETITSSLAAHQTPTSVKQLWFLVAIALCELLMSPTQELWELRLTELLNYALSWGKVDQAYHLTHILLPRGVTDLSTLHMNFEYQEGCSKAVSLLLHIYHVSELGLLHSELQCEEAWTFIQQNLVCEENAKQSENPVDVSSGETENDSTSIYDSEKQENTVLKAMMKEAEKGEHFDCAIKVDKEKCKSKLTNIKFLSLPRTTTEFLSKLHSLCDFFITDKDVHNVMKRVTEVLSNPKELLLQIVLNFKEKGNLKDKDVQDLIFKISSLKS
ncbi:gem-associated protein 5-like isoform X1 [Macrobrachium nipponense]|uniref:gem-associated protein 5-like isoform X1 n=1 Tax=Macrobrachium nipponense TaxID=159736 RepID=UPI0030C7F8EE